MLNTLCNFHNSKLFVHVIHILVDLLIFIFKVKMVVVSTLQ